MNDTQRINALIHTVPYIPNLERNFVLHAGYRDDRSNERRIAMMAEHAVLNDEKHNPNPFHRDTESHLHAVWDDAWDRAHSVYHS